MVPEVFRRTRRKDYEGRRAAAPMMELLVTAGDWVAFRAALIQDGTITEIPRSRTPVFHRKRAGPDDK